MASVHYVNRQDCEILRNVKGGDECDSSPGSNDVVMDCEGFTIFQIPSTANLSDINLMAIVERLNSVYDIGYRTGYAQRTHELLDHLGILDAIEKHEFCLHSEE